MAISSIFNAVSLFVRILTAIYRMLIRQRLEVAYGYSKGTDCGV